MKTTKYTEFLEGGTPHRVNVRMIFDRDHGQAAIITFKPAESTKVL